MSTFEPASRAAASRALRAASMFSMACAWACVPQVWVGCLRQVGLNRRYACMRGGLLPPCRGTAERGIIAMCLFAEATGGTRAMLTASLPKKQAPVTANCYAPFGGRWPNPARSTVITPRAALTTLRCDGRACAFCLHATTNSTNCRP